MIDLERESPLTMAQAAKREPGRRNIATLWRWRQVGVRGEKLKTILIGGRRYTTVEALARFPRVTAAADGRPIHPQPNRKRDSDKRQAREVLIQAGLLPKTVNTNTEASPTCPPRDPDPETTPRPSDVKLRAFLGEIKPARSLFSHADRRGH